MNGAGGIRRWAALAVAAATLCAAPLSWAADRALFWSVEGPHGRAGWLLGTIHSEDPRVLDFPPALLDALAASEVFAMELKPDLPTLARLTEVMHYQDGTTLAEVIGLQRFRNLAELLAPYHVSAAQLSTMKPWAAMVTLSVPPPETGFFMDFSLSLRAAGDGKKVIGLETLDEQLAFLEDMPMPLQLAMLDQAMEEFDRAMTIYQEMLDIYLAGDLVRLQAHAEEQMASLEPEALDYFMEHGLRRRNLRMAEGALPLLEAGPTFIAVGALHLPGEQGLIQLLREAGYTLRPLPNPFASESALEAAASAN